MQRHKVLTPRNIIIAAICLLVSALIITVIIYFGNYVDQGPSIGTNTKEFVYNEEKYTRKNTLTFLVYGIDKDEPFGETYGPTSNRQSDFLMVISLNQFDKTYKAVAVDRDTYSEYYELGLEGYRVGKPIKGQITLAYAQGNKPEYAANNLVTSVERLFADDNGKTFSIDYSIGFNLTSAKALIDKFNGVDVTLPFDASGLNPSWTEGATIHLEGEDAITFIRGRKSDTVPTNERRMERQELFINAFITKVKTLGTDFDVNDFFAELKDDIFTKYPVSNYKVLLNYFKDFEFQGISRISGTHDILDGHVVFYCDPVSLKQTICEVFLKKVSN